ncbi:HAMP domain-containing sensor histidine kinase [uncultured Clostridium sp.]|uniref:sensor histidine kinase n=1 Tax=uncultured Clostridium sp. TaxID=59620 RepID=UPI0025FC1C6C|nr:HAMP domain-containing sensor histidine kinase [uncultured Clostridium sp.]
MKIYFKNIKFILLFLLLVIYILSTSMIVYCDNENSDYNILIVNSYNRENQWENSIVDELKKDLSYYEKIKYNLEYLDSKTNSTKEYQDTFLNLLNLKYKGTDIDVILTIDDEAFNLIRPSIFDEQSFAYKIPMVSVGINNKIFLTDKESEYITTVLEIEDNLKYLNMLIDITPNLSNLIVISDKSIYSNTIRENITSISYLTKKPLEINFIEEEYLNNILKKLEEVSSPESAILIMGDFKDDNDTIISDLSIIIDSIKSITPVPIFTKTLPYLNAGAIGGIMKSSKKHGYISGEIISKIFSGKNIAYLNSIDNTLDITIFNYKTLYNYNINLRLLPKGTIFINKNKFDLLLPKPLKYLTWITLPLIILVFLLAIFKYISDKRTANLNKILLNQALENAKLKTNFVTTISHELRTPLNIILSTTKLISLSINKPMFDKEYLLSNIYYIENNSNRLLKLINNIISIIKFESGLLIPNFTMNNIVEIVENTTLNTVDLAKKYNIEIVFDTDEEEILMSFDKIMIERIILNLISNAIKFSKYLGVIYVSIIKKDNNVIISVEDNGIGIPSNKIDTIFKQFNQIDSSLSRDNEGSGLGLFIVNSFVTLHNGKIEAFSIKNIGSKFDIILPIIITDTYDNNNIANEPLEQLVKIEMSDLK